jgi:murein DD-endopeptidase MepM/ murein hydrolase activator NlpD
MKKILKFILIIGVIIFCCNVLFEKDIKTVDYSDPGYDAAIYWPVPGHYKLTQGLHSDGAIDVGDGRIENEPVHAAVGGTVTHTYYCTLNHEGEMGDCYGFGTGLVIKGDDGRIYQYAHLFQGSMPAYVYKGARIEAGQMVGAVGNTGNSSGNHLHFEISSGSYLNQQVIDPQNEIYKDVY